MSPLSMKDDAATPLHLELEKAPTNGLQLLKSADRPPTVSHSAAEWRELVAGLGTLDLAGKKQRAPAVSRPRPKPSRSTSDQTLAHSSRAKRAYEHVSPTPATRSPRRHPSTQDCSSGEDSAGLGAPPLLPPTLKRAKACSFSPTSSTAASFPKKNASIDPPRQ